MIFWAFRVRGGGASLVGAGWWAKLAWVEVPGWIACCSRRARRSRRRRPKLPREGLGCAACAATRWRCSAPLDELLELDHRARLVGRPSAGCRSRAGCRRSAVEGHRGPGRHRPAAVGGPVGLRHLGRGQQRAGLAGATQAAYRWSGGGVSVNYHLLADLRLRGAARWDELLTQLVAALLAEGLVTMQCVAADGACGAKAGKASYRRASRLEQCLAEARRPGAMLKQLAEESPEELHQRRQAAERLPRNRQRGWRKPLRQCQEAERNGKLVAKKSGRTPQRGPRLDHRSRARVMQFSDGGLSAGLQRAVVTDTGLQASSWVDATPAGTDFEQLPPMLRQLRDRYRRVPEQCWSMAGSRACHLIELLPQGAGKARRSKKNRSSSPKARTSTPRRAMGAAGLRGGADGHGGGQADLSAVLSDGGMGERAMRNRGLRQCLSAAQTRAAYGGYALRNRPQCPAGPAGSEHSQGKRPTEEAESGQQRALARDRRTASPMRQRGESRSSAQKTKKTRSPRRTNPKSHC